MTLIPDEPSVERTLRTGYPQKPGTFSGENIWELDTADFLKLVLKRNWKR